MLKRTGLELILIDDQHYGVLIVVIKLEARHAGRSASVFSNLPKLRRQRGYSTASTPGFASLFEERSDAKTSDNSPLLRFIVA